jgi:hypothetical protein
MGAQGIDFNVAGVCPAILTGLEMVAGLNDPQLKQTPVGATVALSQPENQSAEILSVYGGNKTGQAKQVRIKYMPRATKDTIKTTADCEAGDPVEYIEDETTLDIYVQADIKLSMDEIRVFCEEASSAVAGLPVPYNLREVTKRILNVQNALRQKINDAVVTKLLNGFGVNATTGVNTATQIPVINLGSTGIVGGAPVLTGIQTILSDFSENELNGTPIIIGKGNFEKFDLATNKYGLQNSGVDFSNIDQDYKFFVDKAVNTIIGANQLVVMGEGSAQFLSWNKYVGNYAGTFGAATLFTIPDALVPNLMYDAKFEFDTCSDTFLLRLSVNAGVYILPTDAYGTYDDLQGTNGLLRYEATTVTPA